MAQAKTTAAKPAATKKTTAAKPAAIERVQQNGSWHCPVCDHANHVLNVEKCEGCGAVRDGDAVTPLATVGE